MSYICNNTTHIGFIEKEIPLYKSNYNNIVSYYIDEYIVSISGYEKKINDEMCFISRVTNIDGKFIGMGYITSLYNTLLNHVGIKIILEFEDELSLYLTDIFKVKLYDGVNILDITNKQDGRILFETGIYKYVLVWYNCPDEGYILKDKLAEVLCRPYNSMILPQYSRYLDQQLGKFL